MTKPEVLWNHERGRDALSDIREFAQSLDHYEIVLDLVDSGGKRVYVRDGKYSLRQSEGEGAFVCPECGRTEFEVMDGSLDGAAVLGLLCLGCETYGVVCPNGL